MIEHNFEYTDTKFTLRLMGLCFLVFMALLIGMVVTADLIGVVGGILLAFAVPVIIFLLNKKKIKRPGTATIHESYTEFNLSNSTHKVVYADIKTYQVERYNGTSLIIRFKDGKNFKLQANSNFCNITQLYLCLQDFEKAVQLFKTAHHAELVRKKSIFEQVWMLPLLIVLTGSLIFVIVYTISEGKKIQPSFYGSCAVIIPLWIGYLTARKKKQE